MTYFHVDMKRIERLLLRSLPVRFLIRKSKQVSLPGFEGLPLYDVTRFFLQQTQQIGLNERAGAIAFNFLMAVPPFFIFVFALLSNLPGSRKLYEEALILVRQATPDLSTFHIIKGVMDDFFATGRSLLSFGLLLALYFASSAMITIMRTFNKSMLHIETEKRNFLELRWVAIKLTLYIVLLILGTTFVMVTQEQVTTLVTGWLRMRESDVSWIVQVLRILLTFSLVFVSIALIYRYAPSVEKKWKFFSPGVILATILIIGFSMIFSIWVNNVAAYNRVYGSIGSVLILMLLIYVNSLVLLIGFELNVSINSLKSIAKKRAMREPGGISD
jgi:membrane protein